MKLKLEITCNIELDENELIDPVNPPQQVKAALESLMQKRLSTQNLSDLNVTVTQV